jgi:hypothetical protein
MTHYKITRHNGVIQYATKYENSNEYFLNGFGRGIKEFDALSVEPIDYIPLVYVEGVVHYDEKGTNMKAICDINKKWNGWAMPYIHHSSIKKFIKLTSHDDHTFKMVGDKLEVIQYYDGEIENVELIEPTYFFGEKYYYLGNEGLCFDFKPSKK